MPFDRARTSLAFVEDRFRRMFGLAGAIETTFEPAIRPVVIAGDLRDPGVSSFRGRHWAWHSDPLAFSAGGLCIGIKFAVPVIVESLFLTGLAASGRVEAFYMNPEFMLNPGTLPALTRTGTGTFIDARDKENDYTPFSDVAAAAAAGATSVQFNYTTRIATWVSNAAGHYQSQIDLAGLQINATGALYFYNQSANSGTAVQIGAFGRLF
jgi:hypothetical protein